MIIYLIGIVLAIDLCKEHLTYRSCISSAYQCQWENIFQTCSWSNNYLLGCDSKLSKALCVKQIGSLGGEVGICRFLNKCQSISDLDSIRCSDQVSMGGCLAATKQYCKWSNQCSQLSQQDLADLQSNFMDLQLSISVCPLIDNYLIMHSFTLWDRINYNPDLISLANQLVKSENGNHQPIKQYKSTQLINSYVDQKGNIIWYQPSSLNAFTASNSIQIINNQLKLEIYLDSGALQWRSKVMQYIGDSLIQWQQEQIGFTANIFKDIQINFIFRNNQCNQIDIHQLQNQTFIDRFNITCDQLDFIQCQRYQHASKPCHPQGNINSSVACTTGLAQPATRCVSSPFDSHNTCVTSDEICYLDTTSLLAQCTSTCGTQKTQNSCINYPACQWKSAAQMIGFIYCLPLNSCDQLGLSMKYCIQAYDLCHWNGKRCQSVQNLHILTCSEATTIYTCAKIPRQDQFCTWQIDKCINVYDQQFSGFNKIQQDQIVNRNYCVSMWGGYYRYNRWTFSCQQFKSSNLYCIQQYYGFEEIRPCDNDDAININWLFCLQLFGQRTFWDHETKTCYHLPQSITQNCDDWQYVSQLVCDNALVESGKVCLYNGINCYSHSIDQPVELFYYTPNYQIYKCSEALSLSNCVLVRNDLCEWKDGQCVTSSLQSCKNQNYNACLKSLKECQWSDFTCITYDFQISLVSPPACNNHYNQLTYSCIPITQDDDCTMAISDQQCLSLKAQCQYQHPGCVKFEYQSQTQCLDYLYVTIAVCQNAKYACKYQDGFCVNFSKYDSCEYPGISKSACISITQYSCTWQDNRCTFTQFDESYNQCDSTTIRNAKSCSQMHYSDLPCSYYQQNSVCTNLVNPQSECSLPGLNEYACYKITRSPCQFVDGRCVDYDSSFQQCSIKNVNALSCASIKNEPCAYDEASNSCYVVFGTVPCTTDGLNQVACKQSNCNWNSDELHCQCQVHNNICIGNDRQSCLDQNCKFSAEGLCLRKQCEDLEQCTGYMGSSLCYLNNDGVCQGAQKCEDIMYSVVSCTTMYINGSACQNAGNQCASASNYDLICSADCNFQFCKQDINGCRPYQCQDYEMDKCNSLKGCIIANNHCKQVNTCSEISNPNQCNNLIVSGEQCNWQEYSLMDSTKLCTANWCQIYGPSKTLCNGNEINGRSCILNHFYECQACEQILDSCLCQSSNACYYSNHKCQSMLCGNYLTQLTCQGKCHWSNHDGVCRKPCVQNIREADCRNLYYECNWNKHISLCQQGAYVEPDLSFVITTEYNSGQILIVMILILYN